MDLDEQIQILIDDAPQDGVMPRVMEQAIAPVLKSFASGLQHLEYHVLQTLDRDWVLTTLSNRAQPEMEKKVIYAFATLKDAADFQGASKHPQVIATPVPVIHTLFQMFVIEQADSTIFLETPSNLTTGVEVRRADLHNLAQKQLQQSGTPGKSASEHLPPDIA